MRIFLCVLSMLISVSIYAQNNQNNTKTEKKDNTNEQINSKYNAYFKSSTPTKTGAAFSQAKFVPDISLVMDGDYTYRSIDNEKVHNLRVPGVTNTFTHDPENSVYTENGFNLNYAELVFASVVDPYFDFFANFDLTLDGLAIEELYFTTRSLPQGFKLKAGKFLSNFGRLNEQHLHHWDFAEQPLVYNVMFGDANLNEVGARLTWLAPLDFYLLFGVELLQGANDTSYGYKGFSDPSGEVKKEDSRYPNLYIGYIKTSFDISKLTLLMGGSSAYGTMRKAENFKESGVSGQALFAKTLVLGGDLTIKYQIDSKKYISLQGEYLFREIRGDQYLKDESDQVSQNNLVIKQSGMYVQLTTKFASRWRTGVRYDVIIKNDSWQSDVKLKKPEYLPRYSYMLEFHYTEFSRFRLQYNHVRSMYEEKNNEFQRKIYHEVSLQVNLAIGAHGAHAF